MRSGEVLEPILVVKSAFQIYATFVADELMKSV